MRGGHILIGKDNDFNQIAARELMCGHSYDLTLMDMQMPVMDDLEATRTVRTPVENCL